MDISDCNQILSAFVFSDSFSSLSRKTQIYPKKDSLQVRKDSFPHDRLTHTIEVVEIASIIADSINSRYPGNNPTIGKDILKVMCLTHDLGHSPYGHVGEKAITECLKKFNGLYDKKTPIGFAHNVNSGILLSSLVPDGLKGSIAYALVLDGVIKHSKVFKDYGNEPIDKFAKTESCTLFSRKKADAFGINHLISGTLLNKIPYYRYYTEPLSLEGQILKVSDDIATCISDVVDGTYMIGWPEMKKNIKKGIERGFFISNIKDLSIRKSVESFSQASGPSSCQSSLNDMRKALIENVIEFSERKLDVYLNLKDEEKNSFLGKNYRLIWYSDEAFDDFVCPFSKKKGSIIKNIQRKVFPSNKYGGEKIKRLANFFYLHPEEMTKRDDKKMIQKNIRLTIMSTNGTYHGKYWTEFLRISLKEHFFDAYIDGIADKDKLRKFINKSLRLSSFSSSTVPLIQKVQNSRKVPSGLLYSIDRAYLASIITFVAKKGDGTIDSLYASLKKKKAFPGEKVIY